MLPDSEVQNQLKYFGDGAAVGGCSVEVLSACKGCSARVHGIFSRRTGFPLVLLLRQGSVEIAEIATGEKKRTKRSAVGAR
eukprot:5387670-Pleurochrysis_carterae.AAC.1